MALNVIDKILDDFITAKVIKTMSCVFKDLGEGERERSMWPAFSKLLLFI
jgi:hypothetical protein